MEHDFYFSIQLGMSSSQLTSSIFQRGSYTTNQHHAQGKFADSSIKLWWFFFQLSWGFEHQFEVLRFDQRTQRNVLICSTEFPQGISLDYGENFQIFWGNAILDEWCCALTSFFSSNDGNRIRGIIPKWPNTSVIFTVDLKFSQIRIPDSWLIGGLEHDFYFPFHIWDVILPIDEVHHFSRWLLHHQPDGY